MQSPGKRNTQNLARKPLTLRTRINRLGRRTSCFSQSIQMHDIVLGLFVNRYAFLDCLSKMVILTSRTPPWIEGAWASRSPAKSSAPATSPSKAPKPIQDIRWKAQGRASADAIDTSAHEANIRIRSGARLPES